MIYHVYIPYLTDKETYLVGGEFKLGLIFIVSLVHHLTTCHSPACEFCCSLFREAFAQLMEIKAQSQRIIFLGTSIGITQWPFPRYLLGRTLGRTYLGILIQLQLIFHSLQENNWLLMKYDCLLCYFKHLKSQRICKYSITSKATRNLEWEECGLSDSGLFWSGLMPPFFSWHVWALGIFCL